MSIARSTWTERLYTYSLDHSLREHPVQRELREATRDMKHAGMQIGPEQASSWLSWCGSSARGAPSRSASSPDTAALSVALALPPKGASSRAT